MGGPHKCILMVQIHCVKATIWMAKFCLNGRYVLVYLDASKSKVQGRPNGRFTDVRVEVNLTVNHH